MPVRISENVRVKITVEDEEVIFVFPPYDQMAEAIKALCSRRITGRGMRQKIDLHGPREKFVNETLVDVENVQYKDPEGEWVPLNNKVPGWIAKIPINWRYTAASFFEETEALSAEEMGES